MNRIQIAVQEITQVMGIYDQIAIYRSTTETGTYSEITGVGTRIELVAGCKVYYYVDANGSDTHWYKTAFYDSDGVVFSSQSDPFQVSAAAKVGYTFRNYTPPTNEWGEVLTADDMRHTYLWGIDLQAQDISKSSVDDDQLIHAVEEAVALWEEELDIIIRKRIYKTAPASTLNQKPEWEYGVDYTHELDPLEYESNQWWNLGFLQLPHRPILSIDSFALYDRLDNKILDLLADDWIRLDKFAGQINAYPRTGSGIGRTGGYAGSSVFAAYGGMFSSNYPQGFRLDYTAGYKNSDFVPKSIRSVVGMSAALILLAWVGDGLLAGFSSSSLSLDGLSESFSSTQSATSAFFGARIKDYQDRIKEFRKIGKLKFGNIPIGIITS